RPDGRSPDQLREIRMTRGWLDHAEGSVLVEFGATRVLCAASATEEVPRWRRGSGLGWVTAEYAMLPRATNTRGDRESVKGRLGGRGQRRDRGRRTPARPVLFRGCCRPDGHERRVRRRRQLRGDPGHGRA